MDTLYFSSEDDLSIHCFLPAELKSTYLIICSKKNRASYLVLLFVLIYNSIFFWGNRVFLYVDSFVNSSHVISFYWPIIIRNYSKFVLLTLLAFKWLEITRKWKNTCRILRLWKILLRKRQMTHWTLSRKYVNHPKSLVTSGNFK